jgi:hypothetical protein
MRIYKVTMDISLCISRFKKFNLAEFNSGFPVIFTDAEDPDEACHNAICRFYKTILNQDESKETAKLLESCNKDIKVVKIELKSK